MSKTLILFFSYGLGIFAVGAMWNSAHKALEYHFHGIAHRKNARNYKIHRWFWNDLLATGTVAVLLMLNGITISMHNTVLSKTIGWVLVVLFFVTHYGLRYYCKMLIEKKPEYWAEQKRAIRKAELWKD